MSSNISNLSVDEDAFTAHLQIIGALDKFNTDTKNNKMSQTCSNGRWEILKKGGNYLEELSNLVQKRSAIEIRSLQDRALKDLNANFIEFNSECGKLACMRNGIKESLVTTSIKIKETVSNSVSKLTPFSKAPNAAASKEALIKCLDEQMKNRPGYPVMKEKGFFEKVGNDLEGSSDTVRDTVKMAVVVSGIAPFDPYAQLTITDQITQDIEICRKQKPEPKLDWPTIIEHMGIMSAMP